MFQGGEMPAIANADRCFLLLCALILAADHESTS